MASVTSPINTLIDELLVDLNQVFNQDFTSRINKQGTTIQRDSKRLVGVIFQPVSTNAITYQTAKSFLKSKGATDEAAAAFALVINNLSKITGKSVMTLLREVEANGVGLSDENYKLLNRITDRLVQIGNFQEVDNCLSFNKNIHYFYRDCKPFPPFFTSTPVTSAEEDVAYIYNIITDDINYLDQLKITSDTTLPSWLTLIDNGDKTATLTGTPESGDVGTLNITLRVTDTTKLFSLQSFSIEVTASISSFLFVGSYNQAGGEPVSIYEYDGTISNPVNLVECTDHRNESIDTNDDYLVTVSEDSFPIDAVLRAYQYDGTSHVLVASEVSQGSFAGDIIKILIDDNNDVFTVDFDSSYVAKYSFDGSSFGTPDETFIAAGRASRYFVEQGDYLYMLDRALYALDKATLTVQDDSGDLYPLGGADLGLCANSLYIFNIDVEDISPITGARLRAWTFDGATLSPQGNVLTEAVDAGVSANQDIICDENFIYRVGGRNSNIGIIIYTFNGSDFTEVASIDDPTYLFTKLELDSDNNTLIAYGNGIDTIYFFSFNGTDTITEEGSYDVVASDSIQVGHDIRLKTLNTDISATPVADNCPAPSGYYT